MCFIVSLKRKRSSCASGSGYVPTESSGFCGHHEEEVVELVADVVDGDLLLGHRLEQGRLHLGGGAVDLVNEQHRREHRAAAEGEDVGGGVEDGDAGDVGRQQVGRELHPAEGGDARGVGCFLDERATERLGERGLAGARVVLEQDVAVREEGDQHQLDDVIAADHVVPHLVAQPSGDGADFVEGREHWDHEVFRFIG